MDKRKLIGTIIGVIMFAILIAGATFAFLTFSATVTNATYNGTTMKFLVDYTKGNNITTLPQLASGETTNPLLVTPSSASSLVVVAKKNAESVDGYATISLTTTSTDILTTGGVINWVICRDPDVEEGTQVDDVCGSSFENATNSGEITSSGTITLLSDAALAAGSSDVTTPESTGVRNEEYLLYTTDAGVNVDYSYFVYFWINSTKITNSHLDKTYSGYIHASATQLET